MGQSNGVLSKEVSAFRRCSLIVILLNLACKLLIIII